MVNNYTFPHADINIQDLSAQTTPDPTILPLHIPLFVVFAEKGPVGVPVLGGNNTLTGIFGSQMLNERSIYFYHPNVFLKRALPYQQVMMMRVVDPAAGIATLVLLCTTTPGQIIQYERTSTGALVYGTNGLPIPILNSGVVVTAAGYTLSFAVRALAAGETLSTIATTTAVVTGGTATTYPILAMSTDVGAAGNNVGFRLFYSQGFDASAVTTMGAMTYSLQPVTLNTQTNIAQPIYDIYNDQTQTFAFMPGAYDSSTALYYDLPDVLRNNFNGLPPLPFKFHAYSTNVQAIGNAILAVSTELGSINPYLINFMSCLDQNGNPYLHAIVDATAANLLNANVVDYMLGGSDGTLSKVMLENQTVEVMNGTIYPELGDSFRYPFTHVYDSGYALATKQDLMAVWALRDDVKIDLATQDVALSANTAAMDQSTGSSLRTTALLTPESLLFGTQAIRASIYQQCGTLSDTQTYNTIVPATIDRMIKRCLYNNADYVKGEPKGRPNSEVSIFNTGSLNWTPTSEQQSQQSWNTGLNYMQFCDVNVIFYPDLLSVYPLDTSLLSSDVFVDYLIYLKHIIRQQWTIFSGRTDPPASLYKAIANAIDQRASYAFSGKITTQTVVSQTAVDSALGYQTTVTTTVQGNMPNRIWKVIVPIQRAPQVSA